MKRSVIITTLFVTVLTLPVHAFAATPSAAPSPSTSDKSAISQKLNDEINNLKEKIASRVSELNLVEKRGIIGAVSEVSGNQITMTDTAGKTRFVDVDEITKFSSPASKTFGLSDLTKGKRVSILGLYNKQSKRLLARFINSSVDPAYVSGTISALDTKNYHVTLTNDSQKQSNIDVETTTKMFSYTKDGGLTKISFTKLDTGVRAFAMGYPDKNDTSLIVADRIIVVPSLPKNANVVIPETQPTTSDKSPGPAVKK
jgi:hypothetical protein